MKKNLLLLTLAGLALAGCTSDENLSENASKARIRFEAPLMSKVTRAVTGEISGTDYPTAESFGIYGIQYSGNFNGWSGSTEVKDFWTGGNTPTVETASYKDVFEGHTGVWATAGDYYWVDDPYKLAFAAYSPSDAKNDATISYDAAGFTFADFTVKNNVAEQYDLMYSDRQYDCTRSPYANTGVPLKFNHALSSIVFAATESVNDMEYEITGVKLIGQIDNEGTFIQDITEKTGVTPYSETSDPKWTTVDNTSTTVTYAPAIDGGSYTVTDAYTEFTKGKTAILALPQTVPADAYVELSYTVTTTTPSGPSKIDSYIKKIDLDKFIITGSTSDTIDEWEIGNRYVYLINFGAPAKIFFAPTVNEWIEGGIASYTIN